VKIPTGNCGYIVEKEGRCESALWEMGLFQHLMDDLISVIRSDQLKIIGYYLWVQFRVR